jgi:hypothetical protein
MQQGPSTVVAGSIPQETLGGLSQLEEIAGSLGGEFMSLLTSLGPVVQVMNPLHTIAASILETLKPLLFEALQPALSFLNTIGYIIGTLLAPAMELLAMHMNFLGDIFRWLYNSVIRPVGNFFLDLVDIVLNGIIRAIRSFIGLINNIPGVNINRPNTIPIDDLEYLSEEEFESNAGMEMPDSTTTTGDTVYGGSTSVTEPPDIYVHMYFNGPIVGESGYAQVGGFIVEAIQAYVGAGGEVTFAEAR